MSNRYKPPFHPWEPPEITDAEVMALKNLAAGNANGSQQQMALTTIIQKFSGTYDLSFRPGGQDADRATTFAEGKRFVGQRILEAMTRPLKPQPQGETDGSRRTSDKPEPPAARIRRNPKPAERSKPAKPEAG
jgi:hypothetical protein